MEAEAVCVYDLCDGNAMRDYWADWYPSRGVTVFGGAWVDVPNMPSPNEPAEEECYQWAMKYEEIWI